MCTTFQKKYVLHYEVMMLTNVRKKFAQLWTLTKFSKLLNNC